MDGLLYHPVLLFKVYELHLFGQFIDFHCLYLLVHSMEYSKCSINDLILLDSYFSIDFMKLVYLLLDLLGEMSVALRKASSYAVWRLDMQTGAPVTVQTGAKACYHLLRKTLNYLNGCLSVSRC
ncbi:MAG: hypothetical protein EZS28_043931 [Streblomastix strix]|uniref:Uncharacterized protein n=1 Tax=Streblomastix strix TaxID=222440 RepID=A0A5J4TRL6_9EUKA|nr:MAG: hypothetical protein EZS28_043931 [Streblomastix strix]